MTLTIQVADSSDVTLKNVYPIAVGNESDDHREVQKIIWDDIKSLQRGEYDTNPLSLYDGSINGNTLFSFHMVAVTQDQPERREYNCLMGGNSNYHARFGWSANWGDMKPGKMKSCEICLCDMERLKGDELFNPPRECCWCNNWLLTFVSASFLAPPGYPDIRPMSFDHRHDPKKLEYTFLKDIALLVHSKIVENKWTVAEAKLVMKRWCISTMACDEIIEHATNLSWNSELGCHVHSKLGNS